MATNNNKDRKLIVKILKLPITFIVKARDLYVKSMVQCSGRVYTGGLPPDSLPKSFSVSSTRSYANDEDFRELVRVASTRRKLENDLLNQDQQMPNIIPRSRTVAFGRIDEENEEFEFLTNDNVKNADFYPRSRSVAVGQKRTTAMF